MAALTPKQARFVEEYLRDLNATQAAIRAGYSARTAGKQGPRLLEAVEVRAAIDAAKGERSEKSQIDAERVLQEIAAMAFYDPAAIMLEIGKADPELADGVSIDDDGKIWGLRGPGDIRRLPENVRRAIVGWGYDRNQNFTVKLADKSKALDQLARHLSLYNDKLQVETLDGLAERIERANRRWDATSDAAKPSMPINTTLSSAAPATEPEPSRPPMQAKPEPEPKADPPADWQEPSAPYRPILWPEQVGHADTDYEALSGTLLSGRNT